MMHKGFVETPAYLVAALRGRSFAIPERSKCATFVDETETLRCLVCSAPATRHGMQSMVVAVMAKTPRLVRSFMDCLESRIASTGIKLPRVALIPCEDAKIMLVSWPYRGEFRALVASALTAMSRQDVDASASSLLAVTLPMTEGDGRMDLSALKQELFGFSIRYDPLWRKLLRRATKFEDVAIWSFPLGCQVREVVNPMMVSWEMMFDDLETLERAHLLVDARLNSGKADRLRMCHHTIGTSHETQLPLIRLLTRENSREGRLEMARLIQNVLMLIDRTTIHD